MIDGINSLNPQLQESEQDRNIISYFNLENQATISNQSSSLNVIKNRNTSSSNTNNLHLLDKSCHSVLLAPIMMVGSCLFTLLTYLVCRLKGN